MQHPPLHLKALLSQSSCLSLPEDPMQGASSREAPSRERLRKSTVEFFPTGAEEGPLPSAEFQFLSKMRIPSLPTS